MYYAGMETAEAQPNMNPRKTRVRKAYKGLPCGPNRKPMYRTGQNVLGDWLPWRFSTQPGRGSLVPLTSKNRFRRKPGCGRSAGGLGDDMDESLGLSFNVPGFTSSFTPSPSLAPVTPASGASSFWNPIETITNLWNNRPEAVRKIRVRIDPTKAAQAVSRVLPPGQVGKAVDYARRMGIDPSYLTQFGEVPITGDMAQYGYQARAIDWSEYLPWILGAGAAVVLLPMLLKRR